MSAAEAASLLRMAGGATVFTGAGMSTESGLPDFRSASGLWAGVDPVAVASRRTLDRRPEVFYDFYRKRLCHLAGAAPNIGHHALAALERAGWVKAVVTQNVDGLHQAAGSRRVIELHGNLRESVCIGCGDLGHAAQLRAAMEAGGLPRCLSCGGLLKPNVVLFDELLPEEPWQAAVRAARASRLMLVVGSSLQVTPAAYLPLETLEAGGMLIIVNREPTPYDDRAAMTIRANAGSVLAEIAALLGQDAAEWAQK